MFFVKDHAVEITIHVFLTLQLFSYQRKVGFKFNELKAIFHISCIELDFIKYSQSSLLRTARN